MKAPTIFISTPHSLFLQWDGAISEETERTILQTTMVIQSHFGEDIMELVPSYKELAIYLKPTVHAVDFQARLKAVLLKSALTNSNTTRYLITVPVCYDKAYGTDIQAVANYHSCSVTTVIERHSAPLYRVSFLGFLPGFPYLSGLPTHLHTPRKKTPRPRIDAGSVGIGGEQTGIYPQNSPGGWNIIGKSPLQFFDVSHKLPSLAQAGDLVKFSPIKLDRFQQIQAEIAAGSYSLQKRVYD